MLLAIAQANRDRFFPLRKLLVERLSDRLPLLLKPDRLNLRNFEDCVF
ncbi:MAG: hypothetical protein V7K26_25490 [Nostoc sp.]